jgi:glycosyltransferase involved in cell wall biosynthesis
MSRPPCLIFCNYQMRPTDGGPSGFLAQNLLGHESPYYHLGQFHGEPPRSRWQRLRQGYLSYGRAGILKKIGLAPDSHWGGWILSARHTFKRENAGDYPCLWFHDIWTAAACLDLLRPDQKVILQAHCPELPSEEAASLGINPADVEWTRSAQRRAFARANVVVFPNPGARRIYESLLPPNTRVEFLLSGCQGLKPRCQLPFDPKYIYHLYLGRRNAIKGFDIIMDAFQQAYQEDASLRLMLVGSGDRVQHPGVIDIGRSEDPGLWIANCDYFLNANRQSYFDLSVMEALSLGTPLIVACTSGHQFYAEMSSPGIIALPQAESGLLAKAMLMNRTKRAANAPATNANQRIFDEQLSSLHYRRRLEQMLPQLLAA